MLRSRLVAWGFFVLLVALSTRLLASAVRRGVLLTEESPLLYHAATLGFSYFDFGFGSVHFIRFNTGSVAFFAAVFAPSRSLRLMASFRSWE